MIELPPNLPCWAVYKDDNPNPLNPTLLTTFDVFYKAREYCKALIRENYQGEGVHYESAAMGSAEFYVLIQFPNRPSPYRHNLLFVKWLARNGEPPAYDPDRDSFTLRVIQEAQDDWE